MHAHRGYTGLFLCGFAILFTWIAPARSANLATYSCPANDGAPYTSNGVTFRLHCGQGTHATQLDSIEALTVKDCADRCAEHEDCQSSDWAAGMCYRKAQYIETVPAPFDTWRPTVERPGRACPRISDRLSKPKVHPQVVDWPSCPTNNGDIFATEDGAHWTLLCCTHSPKNTEISGSRTIVNSLRDCATLCSGTSKCRGYVFSSRTMANRRGTCKLYEHGGFSTVGCAVSDGSHDYAYLTAPPPDNESADTVTVLCPTECPNADGREYKSPGGELFHMDCGIRHGTKVIHESIQPTFKDCIDSCSRYIPCHSVDYHTYSKMCYFSNHHGDPTIAASGFQSAYSLGCAGACERSCTCGSVTGNAEKVEGLPDSGSAGEEQVITDPGSGRENEAGPEPGNAGEEQVITDPGSGRENEAGPEPGNAGEEEVITDPGSGRENEAGPEPGSSGEEVLEPDIGSSATACPPTGTLIFSSNGRVYQALCQTGMAGGRPILIGDTTSFDRLHACLDWCDRDNACIAAHYRRDTGECGKYEYVDITQRNNPVWDLYLSKECPRSGTTIIGPNRESYTVLCATGVNKVTSQQVGQDEIHETHQECVKRCDSNENCHAAHYSYNTGICRQYSSIETNTIGSNREWDLYLPVKHCPGSGSTHTTHNGKRYKVICNTMPRRSASNRLGPGLIASSSQECLEKCSLRDNCLGVLYRRETGACSPYATLEPGEQGGDDRFDIYAWIQ